jgi:hypothetical protein
MPQINIRLDWKPPFASSLEEYVDTTNPNNPITYDWIYQVVWANTASMPATRGVYVIENSIGNQVYVGKAKRWLNRFNDRTEALREFRLSTQFFNPVENYTVYLASVTSPQRLAMAEEWLIRILRVAQDKKPPPFLQNIGSGVQFVVPAAGLAITNSGSRPSFLDPSYPPYAGGDKI